MFYIRENSLARSRLVRQRRSAIKFSLVLHSGYRAQHMVWEHMADSHGNGTIHKGSHKRDLLSNPMILQWVQIWTGHSNRRRRGIGDRLCQQGMRTRVRWTEKSWRRYRRAVGGSRRDGGERRIIGVGNEVRRVRMRMRVRGLRRWWWWWWLLLRVHGGGSIWVA